jgi:hypothetical protein
LVFKVAGADTGDHSAVQKHIDTLEAFQRDTVENNRKDFVKKLSEGNTPKILATQIDSLTAFALSLSPEQYEQWSKTWESSPITPLLAQHGTQATGEPPAAGGTTDTAEDHKEVLRATVLQHKRSGMKEDAIKKTRSYQELIKLDPTYSL